MPWVETVMCEGQRLQALQIVGALGQNSGGPECVVTPKKKAGLLEKTRLACDSVER